MPKLYKLPAGAEYPATAADYRLAAQGKPHKRTAPDTTEPVELPYPELEKSWKANGAEEVKPHDDLH